MRVDSGKVWSASIALRRVPNSKYLTLDEYIDGHEHDCSYKGSKDALIDTWDRPEEDIPPERTDEELESMLSKGECTITYANTTKDVRSMCLLCTKEECSGTI